MFNFKLDFNSTEKYTTLYIEFKKKVYEVGILGSRFVTLSDFIAGVHKDFEYAAINRVDLFLVLTKIVRGEIMARSMAYKFINSTEYSDAEKDIAKNFLSELDKLNKGG